MANPERQPSMDSGYWERGEKLNPRHLYVAYIYDQPQFCEPDIATFIEQAQALNYPLRYWWLSQAINLGDDIPDRLILAVNTRTQGEEAGFDLYQALEAEDIFWDEHEAASYVEYASFGKRLSEIEDIKTPAGAVLFEKPPIPLLQLDHEELQEVAYHLLGRQLKSHEITAVGKTLRQYLNALVDWDFVLRDSLVLTQELGLLDGAADKGK